MSFIFKIIGKIRFLYTQQLMKYEKSKLGYCGKRVKVEYPNTLNSRIYLYDDVNIYGGARFIISDKGEGGKFIMKRNSGASQGLTVITGKHGHKIGTPFHDTMWSGELDKETTITVCEDARLGANVTLLPGVTIGRGAQIGACSVVTKDIPPYAIAAGNPAKVIKFAFTPDEIIEHEKSLYSEDERITLTELQHIQRKYASN